VCGAASRLVQVTVVPTGTVRSSKLKLMMSDSLADKAVEGVGFGVAVGVGVWVGRGVGVGGVVWVGKGVGVEEGGGAVGRGVCVGVGGAVGDVVAVGTDVGRGVGALVAVGTEVSVGRGTLVAVAVWTELLVGRGRLVAVATGAVAGTAVACGSTTPPQPTKMARPAVIKSATSKGRKVFICWPISLPKTL